MIEPGHRIDKYEVQRRLGRGGMGLVYLAHDTVLGRLVAIKLFLGDLDVPDARERFIREARSAARLNHPNIVIVHEFGEFSSQPYIVMEYVVGETLAETIRRKSSASLLEKLQWMDDLCAAVSYAHEAGVIHRDIKPTNLMIDRSGRLKVLDFGVARMMGTFGTAGTSFVGTPGYMAPEQIVGRTVDARSDLFSIGVVCYELLVYREAFPGDTVPTVTHRVLNEQPPGLAEISPDIDPELAAAVERALEKSMDDRFPDVTAMRQVLAGVRRRIELGGDTLTITAGADSRRDNRGTGPDRQRGSSKSGSKQEPPLPGPRDVPVHRPTPARVDRIQSALREARSLLEKGDLDSALDACEKALALDDTNPETLEVERAIRAAAIRRRARALLAEVRSLIRQEAAEEAQERLEQVRGLNAELAECALVESELQALRAVLERRSSERSGSHRAIHRDGESSPVEGAATVLTPPRRPSVAPGSDAVTVIAPPRQPAERRTPTPRQDAAPPPPSVGISFVLTWLARQRRPVVVGAAATVLVLGISVPILVSVLRPPEVSPSGTVLIDAVPWGTVMTVRSADGKEHTLPSDSLTPLLINLPPGSYDITVAGPGSGSESRQVRVDVAADGVASAPVVRFPTVTVEDYFKQYLKGPTEPASDVAGVQGADVPVSEVRP
jgi:serine/threonine protein kinase